MSLCSCITILLGSTFGYMIMSLKGESLQFINQGNGGGPIEGYTANHCFTPTTHEPCCHSCAFFTNNTEIAVSHVLTDCVDYPGALKLSLEW